MRNGFTLIELLVVVIILAILAAIAIPRFMAATESAIVAEATRALGGIRESEELVNQSSGNYTSNFNALGTSVRGSGTSVNATNLLTKFWDLSLSGITPNSFTATAVRRAVGAGNASYAGQTITLNENGNWTGSHPLRPTNS